MADPILPRLAIARGQLLHQVGEVQFLKPAEAIAAWSAAQAERDGEVDLLRSELAQVRAELTIERWAAQEWKTRACELAQEVGSLKAQLKRRNGRGGVR